MLNKKIQNKTNLRDEINIILNNHSLKNTLIESQLIISYSAKKINYLDVKFDEIDIQEIKKIVEERIKGKPLSKIIKQKGFWKDIFYTDENTLDPRSDSEILIENILNDFNSQKDFHFNFIDLCCGTGCLGISLLKEFKSSKCDFIDISNQMSCKISALKFYKSQIKENPSRSTDAIKALAKFRGSQNGCDYAEAFKTVRIII